MNRLLVMTAGVILGGLLLGELAGCDNKPSGSEKIKIGFLVKMPEEP